MFPKDLRLKDLSNMKHIGNMSKLVRVPEFKLF